MEGESGGAQEEKAAPAACLSAAWSPSWHPLFQSLRCWFNVVGKESFLKIIKISYCHCSINFISYWCAWDWIGTVNPDNNPEVASGNAGSTSGSERLSNSLETTQQETDVGF